MSDLRHAFAVARCLALLPACVGEPTMELDAAEIEVCEVHLTEPEHWCGGDPVGTWRYTSTCNRTVLEWLRDTCPEGSFVMYPGKMTGALTVTSTSIRGNFAHHAESPVSFDLFEACIEAIGTCPRSYERNPLACEGDFKTTCHCRIEPFEGVGSDQGPVTIANNTIAYNFDPTLRSEFCVESDTLYLDPMGREAFSNDSYYYVLTKSR